MRVRFTKRARDDLVAILNYLDEKSPQGARNVKRAIRKTIELIGTLPDSGRRSGILDIRVLPAARYPYLVYWNVEAGEAWIVHIRHAARRSWRGE
jgi:plasmid stabilization system protein ParE